MDVVQFSVWVKQGKAAQYRFGSVFLGAKNTKDEMLVTITLDRKLLRQYLRNNKGRFDKRPGKRQDNETT